MKISFSQERARSAFVQGDSMEHGLHNNTIILDYAP